MKKTRILATLLCVMMVMTSLPAITLAAPTAAEMDAAGGALGAASIVPVSGLEFDFAAAGTAFALPEGAGTATDVTYAADGLTFGDTQGVWKYYPTAKWCPFSYGPAIYFKAKVAEGGSLIPQAYFPSDKHYRMYYTITSEGASATGASGVTVHDEGFKPGTDYVEYLMFKDANDGNAQILFAKGGTATEWTKIVSATTWREGSNGTGLSFSATKTVIPYMAVVTLSDTKQDTSGGGESGGGESGGGSTGGTATSTTVKDSIAEAAGVSAVKPISGQDFQFASGFDATATGITSPSGATYTDENGLSIPGGAVVWKYHADTANGWSPLSPPAVATVFKAKVPADGILIFQACKNWSHDRTYVEIKPTSVWVCQGNGSGGFASATNIFEFVPGTDWVEYMVMANTNDGYDVYVKGGNAIAGKWHLLASTTSYRPNGGWKATGLNFTGAGTAGAQVKYATVYQEGTASGGGEGGGDTVWEGDYENISDILGYAVKPVDGQDFQFANNFSSSTTYVTTPSGATYDNTNGLDMTGITTELASASWVYKPSAGWGPFTGDPKNSMAFRAKVETGGSLMVQTYYNSGAHSRLYMSISDETVSMGNATTWAGVEKEFDFVPGTDWVDYLITINESNGFNVYVKAATTGNKWKLLASETTWRNGSNQTGIAISGTYADKTGKTGGGYIQYLTVYEKDASGGSTGGGTVVG